MSALWPTRSSVKGTVMVGNPNDPRQPIVLALTMSGSDEPDVPFDAAVPLLPYQAVEIGQQMIDAGRDLARRRRDFLAAHNDQRADWLCT